MRRVLALAFFAVLLAEAAGAQSPVVQSIKALDLARIEMLRSAAPSAEERALASGVALAWHHQDEAALATLRPLAERGGDPEIRSQALLRTAEIHLRQGHFAEAYAAMASAQKVLPSSVTGPSLQTMGFAKLLAGQPAMALVHPFVGSVDTAPDSSGLVRVPVAINGGTENAIIDTGAGFSVLSASAAKRLGVRLINGDANIATSSRASLSIQVGVADRFAIGEAVLSNVVFIVAPDAALTFPARNYKIEAAIGLPVLLRLGRIEVVREEGRERFHYGRKPGLADGRSNLMLAGVEPIVLTDPRRGPALRLLLDSGSARSWLNGKVLADYPGLAKEAVAEAAQWEGAGGVSRDPNARRLPELRFAIGERAVVLKDTPLTSEVLPDRHGIIGQTVLKQGNGWVLDFETMTLRLID